MSGVITFRHVLQYAPVVVHEFGWKVFGKCCLCAITGQHKTFLSIVFN